MPAADPFGREERATRTFGLMALSPCGAERAIVQGVIVVMADGLKVTVKSLVCQKRSPPA